MTDGRARAIDRKAVIDRHDVVLTSPDPQTPLTVGNGDFGCTVDITGMQTFTDFHDPGAAEPGCLVTNTCTQATWAWHEMPSPHSFTMAEATSWYSTSRGLVGYPDKFDLAVLLGAEPGVGKEAGTWLHVNPQRLDLGRVGLILRSTADAEPERDPSALADVHQHYALWSGTITSSFSFAGEQVKVTTVAHPDHAQVAFRIETPLLESGLVEVGISFPYASDDFLQTADWEARERHETQITRGDGSAHILRTLDGSTYSVGAAWSSGTLHATDDQHRLRLTTDVDRLDVAVRYGDGSAAVDPASFDETLRAAGRWWESFWLSGAAIDFGRCTDARAPELERRIVLSQQLTAVHCAGAMPPQETGLVANSWQGKAHLEMHWWHAAHFCPWGRPHLLAKSLDWYQSILPLAQERARDQGCDGARWPKQIGPDGRESPNEIGPFLVWQQPHLLYFAELLYQRDPSPELVARLGELVRETARFMASFAEERDGTFHLLPPLVPAQEFYDRHVTEDPTFELAYWWWGLEIAQRWRERSGQPRDASWSDVQSRLAAPAQRAGAYAAIASEPFLKHDDHPSLLAALGVVPATPLIDADVMRTTLDDVVATWEWDSAWGWDFPMLAMTATRLGNPVAAVDALLMERQKNSYLVNGHNPQMGNFLPVYLPGNGGLLAAVSLMIGGWIGSEHPAPGFPADGSWDIEYEGFTPWP